MAKKKTTAPKPDSAARSVLIPLTISQRDMLCHEILAVELGPRVELWANRFSKQALYPSDQEVEEYSLTRVAPGKWGWAQDAVYRVKTEERDIEFTEKDLQRVRDCYEMMMSRKVGLNTPEHRELKRKFFSEEELQELVDQYDPE